MWSWLSPTHCFAMNGAPGTPRRAESRIWVPWVPWSSEAPPCLRRVSMAAPDFVGLGHGTRAPEYVELAHGSLDRTAPMSPHRPTHPHPSRFLTGAVLMDGTQSTRVGSHVRATREKPWNHSQIYFSLKNSGYCPRSLLFLAAACRSVSVISPIRRNKRRCLRGLARTRAYCAIMGKVIDAQE